MMIAPQGTKLKCGAKGAIVRGDAEMDSDVVSELGPFAECVGAETRIASNGTERVRIVEPVDGWISRKLVDVAGQENDLKIAVEFRGPKDVLLRTLGVVIERGATVGDLKKSLSVMTQLDVTRQSVDAGDDEDPVEPRTYVLREKAIDARGPTPSEMQRANELLAEETKDVHARPSRRQPIGTILGGTLMTVKRQPNYGILPDEHGNTVVNDEAPEEDDEMDDHKFRNIDVEDVVGILQQHLDDDDDDDVEYEVLERRDLLAQGTFGGGDPVDDAVNKTQRTTRKKRKKFYVVFEGDRAQRLLPHAVCVRFFEDTDVDAATVCSLFRDRYEAVRGTGALKDKPLHLVVNEETTVLGPREPANLYAKRTGRLHLVIKNVEDHPASVLLRWGLGTDAGKPDPMMLRSLRITDVACGWGHCVAATGARVCFAWGKNDFGQLGTGDEVPRPTPELCALDAQITRIACGSFFTVAVDSSESLWSWGRYQAANLPTKLAESWANDESGIPRGAPVVDCAAGDEHAAAIVSAEIMILRDLISLFGSCRAFSKL